MLITDLVLEVRRRVNDTRKTAWSDERMLDAVNAALKDIAKFTGIYRKEHFFELVQQQRRYPLPLDLTQVNSVEYSGAQVDIMNQYDTNGGRLFVTKDQVNIGVLEIKNLPSIVARNKRFKQGPTGDLLPQPVNDLWADDVWNNEGLWRDDQIWGSHYFETAGGEGVVSNPLLDPEGVTSGASLAEDLYAGLPNTNYGLLSDVYRAGSITVIPTSGDSFGVLTGLDTTIVDSPDQLGSIGTVRNMPYRIAGRYGTVVSVLKSGEYIKANYKALPPRLTSLETALPLSATWEEPVINFVCGTILQDDNDKGNLQRAEVFLGRYTRELEEEKGNSATDYSSPSKKYTTKYRGGISRG